MNDILTQLNRIRGIGGSLLCSPDGLPMASALRTDIDEDELAATIATLIGHAYRLTTSMTHGKPVLINISGAQGGLVLLAAGSAFLIIITDPHANLALLQLEVKPFVDAIMQRLSL